MRGTKIDLSTIQTGVFNQVSSGLGKGIADSPTGPTDGLRVQRFALTKLKQ